MNSALKEEEYYTYADYLEWDTDERYELIDGIPYLMSPAPTPVHQEIHAELMRIIGNFLHKKPCKVFSAPFDVRLDADGDDDTVVQPDVLVICDKNKIDSRGCVGAPDMVIEITSPSTGNRDHGIKLERYLDAGVKEYWIADPESKTVQVYIPLDHNRVDMQRYNATDVISGTVLQGLQINLQEVFAE
jgi:Uma2 family endonuclease